MANKPLLSVKFFARNLPQVVDAYLNFVDIPTRLRKPTRIPDKWKNKSTLDFGFDLPLS